MPIDPKRVQDIFLAAVEEANAADREAVLDRLCRDDTELGERVKALLKAHDAPDDFLESCSTDLCCAVDILPLSEGPGTIIGPYKLLEQIGEGGFAVVFLAEQNQPVRRKVALKVLKPGMDSRQVVARFEAERQALALMDDPNIARVFDGGAAPSGRPYFVMELVKGVPITEFCVENQLALGERLELFVSVCQAVQHAHQKGIIHRDIKPSNVLVTVHDTTPVVKVIDFGVAKAMGQELTDKTLFTGFAQMVGTPLYMSPEQAGQSGLDVDTRSDIYSLGVLLYELLTGTTPLARERFQQVSYDEVCRILREEDPPKPSTRLSHVRSAASGMRNQRIPHSAFHILHYQELDWIVMKALDKDRNRRYETANGLATDVRRYLDHEPVQAGPPSVAYRLRKLVQRNKGPVLAASLVVLALLGGVIGTTWGMLRAQSAKDQAQKRLAQIEKESEVLIAIFRDLDPVAAGNDGASLRIVLGQRLAQAAQQLEGEAIGDPLIVARLQHELGVSLYQLGHREQAEQVLVKASRTRERMLGPDDLDTAATKHHWAMLCRDQGRYELAESLLKEVLAVRTRQLGADHPDTLASQHLLAMLYHSQGKFTLAETLFNSVVELRTARLGTDHSDTLTSKHRLAFLYRSQEKYDQADGLYKEVLAIRTAKLGPDHLDTVATKANLAKLYHSRLQYDQAERLYKEVLDVRIAKLGAEHPDALGTKQNLAELNQHCGRYEVAEALYREVLAARIVKLGPNDPTTLSNQICLAELYQDQGKYELSETLRKEVLATSTATLGEDHPLTYVIRLSLARLYFSQRKFDQSIPLIEQVLRWRKAEFPPDHPNVLGAQIDAAFNYCEAERFNDAIPLLEELDRKGLEYPRWVWVRNALLHAYARTGKATEATAIVSELIQIARKEFAANSPEFAVILADRARALVTAKAYSDAEPLLRESLSVGEKVAADAWTTHHTRALLGGALLGQQKYADAEPFLVHGYEGLKERAAKIPPEEHSIVTAALERLVELYDTWGKPDEAAKWRHEIDVSRG